MDTVNVTFVKEQIAPCGLNCGTCYGFLRTKNRCPGCLMTSDKEPKSRYLCRIKNCPDRALLKSGYCFDCSKFPCERMRNLDKRYRTKYSTGLIQNLNTIRDEGMEAFLKKEVLKWTCPQCGSVLSCHKDFCLNCKHQVRNQNL
jgi:hypothetical protein